MFGTCTVCLAEVDISENAFPGDNCPECGATLEQRKAVEITFHDDSGHWSCDNEISKGGFAVGSFDRNSPDPFGGEGEEEGEGGDPGVL